MRESDVVPIVASREVGEDILRYVGNRREWTKNHEIKRGLVFNPKTPIAISLRFLTHMRPNDLKAIARSRNIPAALRSSAGQRGEKKPGG